jgi:hypothetical protein
MIQLARFHTLTQVCRCWFFGLLFIDWYFFRFHISIFGLLRIDYRYFFFNFPSMRLSWAYESGCEFSIVARVDSGHFILLFFFQFHPLTLSYLIIKICNLFSVLIDILFLLVIIITFSFEIRVIIFFSFLKYANNIWTVFFML